MAAVSESTTTIAIIVVIGVLVFAVLVTAIVVYHWRVVRKSGGVVGIVV